MDEVDAATKKVACELARLDRWSPDRQLKIADGFTVPIWLTYVSRAAQLLSDQAALRK